jgi:hypothetical protein
MLSKDLLMVNLGTTAATAAFIANLETAITIVVLLTALTINVKKLLSEYKRDKCKDE